MAYYDSCQLAPSEVGEANDKVARKMAFGSGNRCFYR